MDPSAASSGATTPGAALAPIPPTGVLGEPAALSEAESSSSSGSRPPIPIQAPIADRMPGELPKCPGCLAARRGHSVVT